MPGPPPPPPPSGCPPPPMPAFVPPPAGKGGKGGGDERSALLNAIRKQPKLNRVDKALINDRSDPLATSSASSKPAAKAGGSPTHVGGGSMMNGPPNGLGGLFQGGMPKLKSVNARNNTGVSSPSSHSMTNGPDSAPPSMMNNTGNSFGDIQSELRKRLNNESRNTSRGPAPPAPSRNITNELSSLQSKNGYQLNNKTNNSHSLHRKTQSNGNFNTLDSPTSRNNNHTPTSTATTPAKGNFGKPHLAPKPPVLGRPTVPPPSIPAQKVKPPSHAPPPPPSAAPTTPLPAAPTHAPPPPPHRSVPPVPTRAAPAVPTIAPAPPPRNSSMRPSVSASSFENRYVFRPMADLPPPMAFRNVEKVYNTARQAGKQQAPQPPSGGGVQVAAVPQQQLQLVGGHRLWESSTC
ncbi:WAS/WASL-interacting protein family member 3-like isoform X2 [Atheta coriaria]|uniref:WAS/WASL-interacting protein family member 3-like isoform X2 n=1 Tax=Dalotia coriaria TaxID=877792 RepID=UPI0031F38399